MGKTVIFVKLFLLLIFVGACSSEPDEIGLWEHATDKGSIEFKADGRIIMVDNMNSTIAGTYSLSPTGELNLRFTMSDIMKDKLEQMEPMDLTAQMELDGDALKLIIEGQTDNFVRAK